MNTATAFMGELNNVCNSEIMHTGCSINLLDDKLLTSGNHYPRRIISHGKYKALTGMAVERPGVSPHLAALGPGASVSSSLGLRPFILLESGVEPVQGFSTLPATPWLYFLYPPPKRSLHISVCGPHYKHRPAV